MSDSSGREQAVETLQQLGLKEYEAKCFVALSRLPAGTAKEISEISEVPRTRVYDAARVLESKGLVEVQHSKPQQFRAVDISEATEILTQEYETRMVRLEEALQQTVPIQTEDSTDQSHEVWALSGTSAITNRIDQFAREASESVRLVLGAEWQLTDQLERTLSNVAESGVTVSIGTLSETACERIDDQTSGVDVFVSELSWLMNPERADGTLLSRIALVDDEQLLVCSAGQSETEPSERAIIGSGSTNGMVVVVRRLLSTRR